MDSDYRRKLLRNLTTQLIKYGKIKTTLHRAKDLRRLADKMVAYAHKATPASKGKIEAFLFEKSVCQKLLTEMPNRFKAASGGIVIIYVRDCSRERKAARVLYAWDRGGEIGQKCVILVSRTSCLQGWMIS